MRLLALDTATENCSVALLVGEELRTREEELGRSQAEAILGMIDALLAECGVTLARLDAIAFGRGPGAFTGVRLAASVTQGLAFGAGLAVVPVSDLAALAQRALAEEPGIGQVLAVSDARMHEVYWGCFERAVPTGLAGPLGDERVGKPDTLVLPATWSPARAPVMGVGRGLREFPQLVARLGLAPVREGWLPRAREIAHLAAACVARGELVAPEEAIPVYLRDQVTHVRGA
jgi:tRNA threonylcarbamoyladenosine biosynthesis protein TsaB